MIDTENSGINGGGQDDNFALLPRVIEYIRKHLERTDELDLCHIWMQGGTSPPVSSRTISIDELTPCDLEAFSRLEIWAEPPIQYKLVVTSI